MCRILRLGPSLTTKQWRQTCLPLRLGGLGLSVQSSVAESAFLGSWLGLKAEVQNSIGFDPLDNYMHATQRSRIGKAVDSARDSWIGRVKGTGHQLDFDWNEAFHSPWKYQRRQRLLSRVVRRAEEEQWCNECLTIPTSVSFEEYSHLE